MLLIRTSQKTFPLSSSGWSKKIDLMTLCLTLQEKEMFRLKINKQHIRERDADQGTSLLLLAASCALSSFAGDTCFVYLFVLCILSCPFSPLALQVALNQDEIVQAVQYSAKMGTGANTVVIYVTKSRK